MTTFLSVDERTKSKYKVLVKSFIVLVVSALLAYFVFQILYNNKVSELKNIQDQKLLSTATLFSRELGSLRDLLHILHSSNVLIKSPKKPLSKESQSSLNWHQIKNYFVQFGKASDNISQLRWLDKSGQELIRVDFANSQAKIIANDELQNKAFRYYFEQGMKVEAPQIYFSPIDLNVEHGKVVTPYESTIRGTIQTSSKTHLFEGLIVINYRLNELLANISNLGVTEAKLNIINQAGYWLLNEQAQNEWGFMIDKPQARLKFEQPEFWNYVRQYPRGGNIVINKQLYNYTQLSTFTDETAQAIDNFLTVYATSDKEHLQRISSQLLNISIGLFVSLTIIGLTVNWREYRFQQQLLALSSKLHHEQVELKRVNKALQDNIAMQHVMQDELLEAKKLSSLGLMVSGVAHELNTPVGGAIMALSSANNANKKLIQGVQSGISKSQFSRSVETIGNNLHLANVNLDKVVKHIKQFKRLAIDRVNEDYIKFDIHSTVSDLLLSLQPRLKKGHIKIVSDLANDLKIVSRPGIVSQVLENLIMNSLNHAFEPGQRGVITIKARKADSEHICLIVADNGNGIPKDMQSKIMEPFITSARGKGNVGLGLYMVNQWVTKILGGTLKFSSGKTTGKDIVTEFIIMLPLNVSEFIHKG